MTLIVDSSFLIALYNNRDRDHQRARSFGLTLSEQILVPDVVLPEVSYILRRRFKYPKNFIFFEFINYAKVDLEPVLKDDLAKVDEITRQYPTANFDLVDCCIMAIAERRKITRIATFDRRDFSFFQPRHCQRLELLP